MDSSKHRIVILQNYLSKETGGELMLESLTTQILASAPNAEINICAPIQGDTFPDLGQCDLIILTGGPFDLLTDEKPPWVNDTLNFIKRAITSNGTQAATKRAKMLGICWGHQAIALALGGSLARLSSGSCVGVETIPLSPSGVDFFNAASLDIHKRHGIFVSHTGPYLSPIAANNEILVSKDGSILAFQGHPELNADLSRVFASADEPDCSPGRSRDEQTSLKPVDAPHDGQVIFARALKWALGENNEAAGNH